MKKLLLILLVGLLASATVFADHDQNSFAIGGIFGAGFGWAGEVVPDFYPASLSLKIPKVPLFWGLNVRFLNSDYNFGLGVTGDWYFWEPNLVSTTATNENGSYNFKIDWYVGVGFYANMYVYPGYGGWYYNGYAKRFVYQWRDNYVGGDGGLRIPFGVSWHALQEIKKLEVSVGSIFGLGIGGHKYRDKPYFHWFLIPVEVAVRWWF